MDLEHFYESNEARRNSEEIEFGSEWVGEDGEIFQLSWIEATGEMYLMADTPNNPVVDGFGDIIPTPEQSSELEVEVLGTIGTLDEVHSILEGWQDICGEPGSLAWLKVRLSERGLKA